ncbi:HNH endonuclease [Pseudacidovorax sp. RU35E]|uniref:HNH endonuclease n=1 Tax=Pseudacidovorax sp. RU35E TaxID=1907403 RepID=UPI000955B571|nr:HNH endonuclease signature motif containing protein [Pseudacidovorax sp. RU35E]SIR72694.1 HNH endonuclease [Pseudacidovorax sp. RU35E]
MSNLTTFYIQWTLTKESFQVDLGTLEVGDELLTVQSDESETSTFTVQCVGVARSDTHISISLSYQRHVGENAKVSSDWLFGESSIEMEKASPSTWKAIAFWLCEDPESSGPAKRCEVFTAPERRTFELIVRAGQQAFRTALIECVGGEEKCACELTGFIGTPALDAAHIVPHELDPRPGNPENGLLLRADLHRLYDRNVLRISPNGEVSLVEGWIGTPYPDLVKKISNKTLERVRVSLERRAELEANHPKFLARNLLPRAC